MMYVRHANGSFNPDLVFHCSFKIAHESKNFNQNQVIVDEHETNEGKNKIQ